MGGAACPLYDPGNHRSIERGSDLQAARRGSLTTPAKPAGERESDAALTPRPGTRSIAAAGSRARDSDRFRNTKPAFKRLPHSAGTVVGIVLALAGAQPQPLRQRRALCLQFG